LLHYFLPFLDDAHNGIASFAAWRLVQFGKYFVEAFDVIFSLSCFWKASFSSSDCAALVIFGSAVSIFYSR
jgi:hypothetical protein